MIGRIIHGGIYNTNVSEEEERCQKWLGSLLVQNGLEEREKIRGIRQALLQFLFVRAFQETSKGVPE